MIFLIIWIFKWIYAVLILLFFNFILLFFWLLRIYLFIYFDYINKLLINNLKEKTWNDILIFKVSV